MLKVLFERNEEAVDRMIAHLQGKSESPLSEKDQEIMDRLLLLSSLRLEHLHKASVIPMYERISGVSKSQAYLDWKDMERMVGDMEESRSKALRPLYTDRFERLSAKAEAEGDYKTAILALKEAARINKLDQQEVERPAYEEFLVDQPAIGYYPKLTDTDNIPHEDMLKILDKAVGEHRDKMKIRMLEIEDVEYTETDEASSE